MRIVKIIYLFCRMRDVLPYSLGNTEEAIIEHVTTYLLADSKEEWTRDLEHGPVSISDKHDAAGEQDFRAQWV